MESPNSCARDPRLSVLKARLIRKMHDDLPYAIRFVSRMDRLGARLCKTEIPAIVEALRVALIHEVIDVLAGTEPQAKAQPRRRHRALDASAAD